MTLRARSESLPLLTELRSEALKDRHWRPLLRRLGIRVGFQELNLGLLWGSSLMGHKKGIGETVLSAQGEMALEEFLRQVRRVSFRFSLFLALVTNFFSFVLSVLRKVWCETL